MRPVKHHYPPPLLLQTHLFLKWSSYTLVLCLKSLGCLSFRLLTLWLSQPDILCYKCQPILCLNGCGFSILTVLLLPWAGRSIPHSSVITAHQKGLHPQSISKYKIPSVTFLHPNVILTALAFCFFLSDLYYFVPVVTWKLIQCLVQLLHPYFSGKIVSE